MLVKQLVDAEHSTKSGPQGRCLPGFPAGWFAVGFSHDLARGEKLSRRFMGQQLALYRTHSGRACAADPICPHRGANMLCGGTIVGETIICPFHGFGFEPEGACVSTGTGNKPPPTARLRRTWPLREVNGLLLAFHDHAGHEPTWEVPVCDEEGWTPPRTGVWRLATHPQLTSENSIDLTHFRYVHGYQAVDVLSPLMTDGPHLITRYAMQRPAGLFARGKAHGGMQVEFEVHLYGLGYSLVKVCIPDYQLQTRHLICATPTEPGWIELRVSVSMKRIANPAPISPLLRLLPRSLVNSIVSWQVFQGFTHDLRQDFSLWENQCYVDGPPLPLEKDDGPFVPYTNWTRQFYPGQGMNGMSG